MVDRTRHANIIFASMRLLLVEDETKPGQYLQQGLTGAGFIVDLARNGKDGLHLAMSGDYDLLILDLRLLGLNGWKILQSPRRAGLGAQVLLLITRGSVADRAKRLELDVDDYLVKPFAFAELLARVRTLLHRGVSSAITERIHVADLVLDLLRRRASRAGRKIALTSKEFSLLELLVRHSGEVLPRSLIASQVWDMNFDSDTNVIDVAIHRLRAKIDDDFEPKLIHTVRGMGYVLEGPVEAN